MTPKNLFTWWTVNKVIVLLLQAFIDPLRELRGIQNRWETKIAFLFSPSDIINEWTKLTLFQITFPFEAFAQYLIPYYCFLEFDWLPLHHIKNIINHCNCLLKKVNFSIKASNEKISSYHYIANLLLFRME